MPYTPPSQRSPAASKNQSPVLSRSQSYAQPQEVQAPAPLSGPRPGLPRSTSSSAYLSKHRRGPSFTESPISPPRREATSYCNGGNQSFSQDDRNKLDIHGSIRQSPPPVNNALIPTGAMISPPDSSHNSSDDEESHRGRSRELENLAELQAAIEQIEQHRESSPNGNVENSRNALAVQIPQNGSELIKSFSADDIARQVSRPPLSREARKISHSRSTTDSHIMIDASLPIQSPVQMQEDSDVDDDDAAISIKPSMVRKKSGELVRPALRPSSAKRRPSSMPGTPTYSKAVHFDSHLEHVRHFLQVDKPLAVSAGSSPVDNYESEIEFPFGNDETTRSSHGPGYEWEIKLSNFPTNSEERKHLPVRVERVFLSSDNKNLVGQVAVQNLSFYKNVVSRFTFDYWKTTSEVSAEYNNDVRRKQNNDGCDRFNFSIRLTDIGNLESKTLFFCVRYSVNGREFWDNNGSINYQVDFAKKAKESTQSAKNSQSTLGSRPLNTLPRSRPSPPVSTGRPHSSPADSFDDFSTGFGVFNFGSSPDSIIGDPQLKLRNPRARAQVVPDAPTRRPKPTSTQAFGNRYDFGASLNAAIQNASTILGDQSGLVRNISTRNTKVVVTPPQESKATTDSKTETFLSQKPSHQSQSYQELVDKYCFFGSTKSSPQLTKSNLAPVDGASDEAPIPDVQPEEAKSDKADSLPHSATKMPLLCRDLMNKNLSNASARSSSPLPRKPASGYGSHTSSSLSFGYPYHSSKSNNFFESHVEFAIQG